MPLTAHNSDRLQRIEQARELVFQGRSGHLRPGESQAGVSPWLTQSWKRCLAMGLQPQQSVGFDTISAQQMRRVQENSRPLVQAAQSVLVELARAIADIRYFAILTNAQGIVVDVHGPVDRQDRRADAIARVGVDLSERSVGTTSISAALTELQPVWLHRGEHFFQDNSVYSCAGAPVFGPDGLCAGMLDLTGIETTERPALKHLVRRSARSIENSWLLSTDHALVLRLNWPGNQPGDDSDGLITLDHNGQIVGANPTARQMLSLSPDTDGQTLHASEVFASPWENLFDAASRQASAQELPLWSGLRLQTQALRPGTRPAASHSAKTSERAQAMAKPLKDVQTDMIREAVQQARGNVAEAARSLGISRATVYRKLGLPKA
ncbi:helix-turn-helix domain-containing protein [Limnohabitans planktonicus]|uniref:Histidine kinase n=1 Tax=Limnohabitans planktonicus II-D5 TaxID=1293045 RepID=A0A2T7UDQ7_9BURK|nr:helix-turn-helix domain-containing protein [Limnohabitans planktonicus]PVE42829.1 histidine kinase [Limnohabitans planktonicus II-D5]|eukprot:gene37280-48737_t